MKIITLFAGAMSAALLAGQAMAGTLDFEWTSLLGAEFVDGTITFAPSTTPGGPVTVTGVTGTVLIDGGTLGHLTGLLPAGTPGIPANNLIYTDNDAPGFTPPTALKTAYLDGAGFVASLVFDGVPPGGPSWAVVISNTPDGAFEQLYSSTFGQAYTQDFGELGVFGIDGVSGDTYVPTGVPEPATWALTLAGFGLAGATLRARRRMRLA